MKYKAWIVTGDTRANALGLLSVSVALYTLNKTWHYTMPPRTKQHGNKWRAYARIRHV